eukprot:09122.XXX_195335_195541_1 [CDS] Oithona nana genome sequencing.
MTREFFIITNNFDITFVFIQKQLFNQLVQRRFGIQRFDFGWMYFHGQKHCGRGVDIRGLQIRSHTGPS